MCVDCGAGFNACRPLQKDPVPGPGPWEQDSEPGEPGPACRMSQINATRRHGNRPLSPRASAVLSSMCSNTYMFVFIHNLYCVCLFHHGSSTNLFPHISQIYYVPVCVPVFRARSRAGLSGPTQLKFLLLAKFRSHEGSKHFVSFLNTSKLQLSPRANRTQPLTTVSHLCRT